MLKQFLNHIIVIILISSCENHPKNSPFPINESEYNLPVVKPISEPKVFSIRPDTVKLLDYAALINLSNKKNIPFIDTAVYLLKNERKITPLLELEIKKPDTVFFCNTERLNNLNKVNKSKVQIKVEPPTIKKTNQKIVLLGQPDRLICKQPAIKENSIYNIQSYTQDQGLIATAIFCMNYDKTGNLWLGTDGGLYKFDGKEWLVYTTKQGLSHNFIYSMLQKRNGDLLIGTAGGGLNIIDNQLNCVKQLNNARGLTSNYIQCLYEGNNGSIYVGTDGGGLNIISANYKFVEQYTIKQGLGNNYIKCIYENKDDQILLGTLKNGINIIDRVNKTVKRYGKLQGLCSNNIKALMQDNFGNIYVGTAENGIDILDKKFSHLKHIGVLQGLTSNNTHCLYPASDSSILIGTSNGGLNIINPRSNKIKWFTTREGLNNNNVRSIKENAKGEILIGTIGGGLNILDGPDNPKGLNIKYYSTLQGLSSNMIGSFYKTRANKLLLGTNGGGLNIIDSLGRIVNQLNELSGLSSNYIVSIEEDKKGNFFLGTWGGGLNILDSCYKSVRQISKLQGLSHDHVISLCKNDSGDIFAGTLDGGLNVIDFNQMKIKQYSTKHGIGNNTIHCLFKAKKNDILIGTDGGGLSILSDAGKKLRNYTTKQGLTSNIIECIIETKNGQIVVGTNGGGLNIFNKNLTQLTTYSNKQGLPSNQILSIVEDKMNNLWVGTMNGMCKLVKIGDSYTVKKIYSRAYGLKRLDFNPNNMVLNFNGNIWAGIGDVIMEFNPQTKKDTSTIACKINEVILKNSENVWLTDNRNLARILNYDTIWTALQDTFYTQANLPLDTTYFVKKNINYQNVTNDLYCLPTGLVLPINQNHLTFRFAGISASATSSEIRYRYILDGLEENWNTVTDKGEADYRNIPSGNYIFKVSAKDVNGIWSKPAQFAFKVLPAWYLTIPAYILYITMLVVSISLFLNWKQKKYKKFSNLIIKIQEDEKFRISRELHDDLGQELLFLKMSEEIKNKHTIDSIIQKLRSIAYNLKPIKLMESKIKELMVDLVNDASVSGIFFSCEIEDITIKDPDVKINAYRIAQEAINNIIKHSSAENARVLLSKKRNKIVLEIMDDGIGISKHSSSTGIGQTSMRERAKLINGNLLIESKQKGTYVKLEVILKDA